MASAPFRISWLIALMGIAAFVGIAWAYPPPSQLSDLDRTTALALKEFGDEHAVVRGIMIGFTHAGGVIMMVALAACATLWHLWRKEFALAGGWVIIVAGGALLNQGIKHWLDRPRPEPAWRDAAVTETNYSYPSGHAMGSIIGYGMLAYVLCLTSWSGSKKLALVIALAAVVALIGFSRVFLRAHWLSDVLGGFGLGAAWLAIGIGWLEWQRARSAPPPTPLGRSPC